MISHSVIDPASSPFQVSDSKSIAFIAIIDKSNVPFTLRNYINPDDNHLDLQLKMLAY